ncbi:MAG: hypothetical protein JO187_04475, partial [Acidobacteria bacterium]|nr:hypothetical protein [Acidobacteriota bacterium]
LNNGGLPSVLLPPPTVAAARKLTTSFIDDTVMPKIFTYSLGIQHELYRNATMEVRYLGTRGLELPVQYRMNHESFFDAGGTPLPTYLTASSIPATYTASTPMDTAYYNFSSFKPEFEAAGFTANVTGDPPKGSSRYNGLAVNFIQRSRHGLTMNANWTWSHAQDNSTNEFFTSFLNPRRAQDTNQLRQDWSNSDLDVRHHFALAMIYQVPGMHTESALMRALVNGFGIGSTYLLQTGQPITLQSGNAGIDSNGNGDSAGDRGVLNPAGTSLTGSDIFAVCASSAGTTSGVAVGSTYVAPVSILNSTNINGCANNPSAPNLADPAIGYTPVNPNARYVLAGPGAVTTIGRNSFYSPGFGIWNVSAFKTIKFTEGTSLQIRGDAYNVLNQRNYTLSNTNVFSTAGVTTATSNPGYAIITDPNFLNASHFFSGGNRTMTIAVHFNF